MKKNKQSLPADSPPAENKRRKFLKTATASGAAVLAAPYIGNAEAAKTTSNDKTIFLKI